MYSDTDLLRDINEFLETPIHVHGDGPSQLQTLLLKHHMDVASAAIATSSHKEVAARFMQRSQDYPEGKTSLLTSPSLGNLLQNGDDNNEKSLKFVLADILCKESNVAMLSEATIFEVIPFAISWMALDSIAISNTASNLLLRIAQHASLLCERVTSLSMDYLRMHPDMSTTIMLRYLSLFCKIMESDPENSAICLKYGCPAAVMKAIETPDFLVQVPIIAQYSSPAYMICFRNYRTIASP